MRNFIIPIIIVLLTTVSLVLSLYSGVTFMLGNGSNGPAAARLVLVVFAIAVVSDFIIAISTITIFALSMKQTQFKSTKAILRRLVLLSVETGTLTASIALVGLILHLTTTGTYYSIFGSIGDKAYVVSMMASLNSRRPNREEDSDFVTVGDLESTKGPSTSSSFSEDKLGPSRVAIGKPIVITQMTLSDSYGETPKDDVFRA
ncbi:hypothetical protein HGRIS_011080 [Hohenbuehelia grisea]|uniref:DUF6534 domain-containing protein n=1 Tax=Hohenbuehelia grisea TaxID=104357 RepID=A0ABR3IZJ9_9AGAR